MKRILFLVFVFICSPLISFAYTANDFVITVDTTLPGSASDTFQLPTTGGGYDAVVDWGGRSDYFTFRYSRPGIAHVCHLRCKNYRYHTKHTKWLSANIF